MRKIQMIVALIVVFAFNFTSAQSNELLKKVQDKFNSASTISADIKQSGSNNNMSGKVFFKKENKFRLELSKFTLISDGSTVWNYNKNENKVVISTYDENEPSSLSIDKILNDYPERSIVTSGEENGKEYLLLKPKNNADVNFNSVKLLVNDDNLVDKVMIDKSGNKMEINLSNYQLNQDIPDSRFSFAPPEGSKVIDLR